MMLTALALSTFETAINACLRLDPHSVEQIANLEGKVIAVELTGIDLRFYLVPAANGFQVVDHCYTQPDTHISGTPIALLKAGCASDKSKGLFSGDVTITGDVQLGQQITHIIDNLEIDWEEHLSKLVGDTVAHGVGNFLRDTFAWGEQAHSTLKKNLDEYLHEEIRCFPPREEIEDFCADVAKLRDDVERLAARMASSKTTATQVTETDTPTTKSTDKKTASSTQSKPANTAHKQKKAKAKKPTDFHTDDTNKKPEQE